MGMVAEADVRTLLQDQEFIDDVVSKVIADPKVLDELAEDIADELEDILEDDPTFKQKVIEAAMASPEFKQRVVTELIREMSD